MVNWLRNSKVLTFSHFFRVFWGTLGWDVSIEGKLTNQKVLTHKLTNKETRHRWNTLTDNWGRSHSRGWNASSQPSSWNAKPVPNSCSKALVDRPRGKQSLETINLNIFWLSALYCHEIGKTQSGRLAYYLATNWAPAAIGSVSEAKLVATWQKLPHRVAADSRRDNAGHETSVILGYKGRLCLI